MRARRGRYLSQLAGWRLGGHTLGLGCAWSMSVPAVSEFEVPLPDKVRRGGSWFTPDGKPCLSDVQECYLGFLMENPGVSRGLKNAWGERQVPPVADRTLRTWEKASLFRERWAAEVAAEVTSPAHVHSMLAKAKQLVEAVGQDNRTVLQGIDMYLRLAEKVGAKARVGGGTVQDAPTAELVAESDSPAAKVLRLVRSA